MAAQDKLTAKVDPHGGQAASRWVQRWSHLVPAGAAVLDVACGSGRHVCWFAQRGGRVTGVDRDAAAVAPLTALAEIIVADIEGAPWPLAGRTFDAVVVTNYLWRERLPELLACVATGGVLMYETFSAGNESVGKPSNPKFLLQPGELLQIVAGWRVIAFEDGFEPADPTAPARFVQRIVAVRDDASPGPAPRRFGLVPEPSPAPVKSLDSEDSA